MDLNVPAAAILFSGGAAVLAEWTRGEERGSGRYEGMRCVHHGAVLGLLLLVQKECESTSWGG